MTESGRRVPPFPESLRVHDPEPVLEAFGLRARIAEVDGALIAEVDSGRAEIEVVRAAESGAAAASTVELWPFGAERSRARPDGSKIVAVRLFAAPDAPLVVVEWESPDPEPSDVVLRVRRLDEALVLDAAAASDPAGSARELRLQPTPGRLARIVIRTRDLHAPEVEHLMAAALARARRREAARPKVATPSHDRLAAAEHALRSALKRESSSGLIRATRAAHPDPAPARGGSGEAAFALALLALNDRTLARALLASDLDPAALALMAGGWAAWTGDAEPLAAIWGRVASWTVAALETGESLADPARPARSAAFALSPVAAELAGDADLARRLRGVTLPEPAAALADLGRAMAVGQPAGRSTRAAAAVLACMHGDLGIAPDAPRGRVRLAPRLEGTPLRVVGLTIGEARFSMDAGLEPGSGAFVTLAQTDGPAPFNIVVEPWLPAGRLKSASVDGVAAHIEAHPEATGLRARVQVVADHERRIRFEIQ